jgi:hypothetical protein
VKRFSPIRGLVTWLPRYEAPEQAGAGTAHNEHQEMITTRSSMAEGHLQIRLCAHRW